MKTRTLISLILICLILTGSASAAWTPADFASGSLSDIVADGQDLLVSDVYNNVIWRIL